MKRITLTRLLILTLVLGLVSAFLLTGQGRSAEALIADDFDREQACQDCLNQAYADWQACWQRVDDIGDAACRASREDAEVTCQREKCIDTAQNQSPLQTIANLISPTVNAAKIEGWGAPGCVQACIQNRNLCNSTCDGNATCLAQCQAEYECCQILCHGRSCRTTNANSKLSTLNFRKEKV